MLTAVIQTRGQIMTFRSLGLLFGFAIVTLTQPIGISSAASKTINCSPAHLKIVTSSGFSTTASTTFVDIPEATVSFVQGGSAPSCVIVRFSGESGSKDNGLTIRPLLDVRTKALPTEAAFAGMECIPTVGCTTRSYAFEFVFPSVAPGTHLLRMQYEAAFSTSEVFMGRHNTVVQYSR